MTDDWSDPTELPDDLKTPDQRREEFETTAATPNGVRGDDEMIKTTESSETGTENANERIDLEGHEDFVQRKLLEDIIIARRDAAESIAKAPLKSSKRDISQTDVDRAVYGRVWRLISLVKSTLTGTETGKKYWNDEHIGRFTIETPGLATPTRRNAEIPELDGMDIDGIPTHMIEELSGDEPDAAPQPASSELAKELQEQYDIPSVQIQNDRSTENEPEYLDRLTVNVSGLSEYCSLDPSPHIRWDVDTGPILSSTSEPTEIVASVPVQLSRSAYDAIDAFLSEIGFEAQVEDTGDVEIDLDGY
jgi:hypothetical protein